VEGTGKLTLTARHLEKIKENAEKVKYGKVTIMIDDTRKYIDIITEERERIENEHLTESRKG
jgi:hypothetical protein